MPTAEELADRRPEVRREAILALAEIGPAAAPAVAQLAAALDDKLVETPATYALGRIGKIPAAAEAKIAKNVEGQDKVLRVVSLWALARIHPEDKQLVRQTTEQLIERLMEEDPRVRAAAARALAALEPGPEIAVPALQKVFEGADEEVVRAALDTLVQFGSPSVPRLIEALKYEGVRGRVAFILGEIGPSAAPATEALAKLIDDKDPDVSNEAIHALAKIGPDAKAAVPALVAALKKRRGPICFALVFALGKIGPDAVDAKPVLLKTVDSKDESLSLISAWSLTQIHPQCPECAAKALPVLTAGLADPSPRFRRGAAEALRSLGPRAKPAEAALKRLLDDEDPEVRQAAADALEAIAG